MSQNYPTLSVVGLGKLGACMAAVFAEKQFPVIGVDLNEAYVQSINDGRGPVQEPDLDRLISENASRLSATTDLGYAVAASEVTFIIVPTPSDDAGLFTTKYVEVVSRDIGRALKGKAGYHLVVVTSTVMPGDTRKVVMPILEEFSGKVCGKDFGLCYSPEFIALGTVIRDMKHPDFLLIGESDERAGAMLQSILTATHTRACPISRMNFVNAELAKIAVNTFVTTKISYANMLAQICETLPGGDSDVVSGAIGLDSRIGRKYLKGALAYGGPCFPRDNVAFAALARQNNVDPIVAEATDRQNKSQRDHLCRLVRENLPEAGIVAVLGLSYKAGTVVIDCSPGMEIVRDLQSENIALTLYDPQAMDNAQKEIPPGAEIEYAKSARDAVSTADVTIITVPWPEFQELSPLDFKREKGEPTIIDCWRLLAEDAFSAVAQYITVGRGPRIPEGALKES
jgi:UDPglucose 6-dehydrogenase